ncbi:methyl-accepting chemotaxis protein [Pseudomonas sp.]|uniref:methyl-accepting chemotaxis protein n=1 Tax=Pseudomonas sp. TaxID=306 RepID=UPI0028B181E5|nr:methyl-accepting chemotaxis protein [Pseudomonas sp.]
MKNWTVRLRIQASFAVIIAIMLLMAATSYERLAVVSDGSKRLTEDAMPGLAAINSLRGVWTDNFHQTVVLVGLNGQKALTEDDLAQLKALSVQLDGTVQTYQLSVRDVHDQGLLDQFRQDQALLAAEQARVIELYQQRRFDEAVTLLNGRFTEVWNGGRSRLSAMVEFNKQIAKSAGDDILSAVATAKAALIVSLLLAIAAAVVCGYYLMRAITGPVRQVVNSLQAMASGDLTVRLNLGRQDEFGAIETGFNGMAEELKALVSQAQRSAVQVTTSVTEIAATSREQQATATESAATTTQIGATSREIAATSRDLVRTMSEVSGAAEQTSTLAGSGQLGLARMEDTMHQVMGAAELVNAKLAILNEKAGNINQVVTTIVKVADQTNLLSLNAAIEAEKAGEYGRGFAVVATEVRRLADQTAVATYDIEQMVREIQSAVSAGVMGMDKFSEEVRRGIGEVGQVGEQLTQIIQQVQALAPRVQMVNEGMQAQSTGADQINQALVQLGEASGQTVESLRQASAAIDELNLVANGLRTGVSGFKV